MPNRLLTGLLGGELDKNYLAYLLVVCGKFVDYFRQGGEGDVRRTYNNTKASEKTFVDDFRHYGSFVFGIACRAAGFTIDQAVCAGGAYNSAKYFMGKVQTADMKKCGNNPPNDTNIKIGFNSIDRF